VPGRGAMTPRPRRTAAERNRSVEGKRPVPAPVIADGTGPIPRAVLDVLARMLARGRAKRAGSAS
jgi:hypothetical protein